MEKDIERINRIKSGLISKKIDALICRLPENVLFLTGYWSMNGFAFALFTLDRDPVLILPEGEADQASDSWAGEIRTFGWGQIKDPDPYESISRHLNDIYQSANLANKSIGFEGGFELVAPSYMAGETMVPGAATFKMMAKSCPEATLVDATDLLNELRATKTNREIEALRLTHEIAGFGLEAFRDNIQAGLTEAEVAATVEFTIYAMGTGYKDIIKRCRSWAYVMSGPNTVYAHRPYNISTNRKLQNGDLVLIELGVVADGFWADLTRTRVVGKANEKQLEINQVVLEAQAAAVAAVKVDSRASDVDAVARAIIEGRGYGQYFVHHTGHGIGFRYHEPIPALHPSGTEQLLKIGMVSSVEPGIYIPDFGGIRQEDNIVVADNGAEYLSNFERNL